MTYFLSRFGWPPDVTKRQRLRDLQMLIHVGV